jgi:hypothetical protein
VIVVTPLFSVCVPGWPLPLPVVTPLSVQLSEATLQLSEVLTVKAYAAVHTPASVETVALAAAVTVGAWLSLTVTVVLEEDVLPEASVTV